MNNCLYIIILWLCFSSLLLAADTNQNGHEETVAGYVKSSDSCGLIAIFKSEWIPADKNLPKGRIVKYGRVVRVFKGTIKVGDQIRYTHLIEEPPKWLKAFVRGEAADLYFLLFHSSEVQLKGNVIDLEHSSRWVIEFDNALFSDLLKKKLGYTD